MGLSREDDLTDHVPELFTSKIEIEGKGTQGTSVIPRVPHVKPRIPIIHSPTSHTNEITFCSHRFEVLPRMLGNGLIAHGGIPGQRPIDNVELCYGNF